MYHIHVWSLMNKKNTDLWEKALLFTYLLNCPRVWGPQDQLQVWFARRTHRVQKIVDSHCYDLLQRKDTKQNQHREKAHGAKPGGNEAPASESLLSLDSHRTRLIPPALGSDNTWEMLSPRDTHRKLSAWVFVGADYVGTLCLRHTKIPDH